VDAGYDVMTGSDPAEGMARMEHSEPDLITLALDLGGESGLTLMTFLQRNQPNVPVVLYRGLSHDDEHIQAMLKQGANQYVRKGPLEELLKAVWTALSDADRRYRGPS
jgi:DNA-binding response OmpR family regulator